MSAQGAEYYQARAEHLNVDALPGILDGIPVRLLDDGEQRLSFQKPDEGQAATVTERYGTIVTSLNGFVSAGLRNQFGDLTRTYPPRREQANERHLGGLAKLLRPNEVQAGHICDIQTEAIARSEIKLSHIRSAARGNNNYAPDEHTESQEVYLRTSAALYTGRKPLGFVACLSVVAAKPFEDRRGNATYTIHYMGAAFKQNDLLAKSAIAESRAIANYVVAWGLQNEIVNNTHRGKGSS
ncbi:MAG TPA: hypothetical protein VJR27_00655 [Candidatus Saccharimonadales bacterium]|nr:hypothetical protein [Candidatus Saccharimonadales bacterium]